MVSLMQRRRAMMEAKWDSPTALTLLEQGTVSFNAVKAVISGNDVKINKTSGMDAYNKFRTLNLTDFSANVTTGQNKTEDITGKPVVRTIPAGATCVFSMTNISEYFNAGYCYIVLALVDGDGNTIKQVSRGRNAPSATSVSWTQNSEIGVACIAAKIYHFAQSCEARFYLSLTVNGEEWLV